MNAFIRSISTYIPEPRYTTDDLLAAAGDKFSPALREMLLRLGVDTRPSILSNYTDVLFRRAAPQWSMRGTELAACAARKCLAQGGAGGAEIGLVIGVTSSPPRLVPSMVADLFAQMPELPREAMNLSIQGMGCSPLLKAVDAARWYLHANPKRCALIVCMESTTALSVPLDGPRCVSFQEAKGADDQQRTVDALHALLFSDGAVALLLSAEGPGPAFGPATHLTNENSNDTDLGNIIGGGTDDPSHLLRRPQTFTLGPGVDERGAFYAMDTLQRLLADPACAVRGTHDASQILIHTGSRKVLDGICRVAGLERAGAQVAVSYDTLARYGNLAGASLGFMLADALPGAKGDLLLVSFGLGFSASSGVVSMPA